jgi:hypothetical protein
MGLVMGAAFYRVEARNTARSLGVCWAKACRSNEGLGGASAFCFAKGAGAAAGN